MIQVRHKERHRHYCMLFIELRGKNAVTVLNHNIENLHYSKNPMTQFHGNVKRSAASEAFLTDLDILSSS